MYSVLLGICKEQHSVYEYMNTVISKQKMLLYNWLKLKSSIRHKDEVNAS